MSYFSAASACPVKCSWAFYFTGVTLASLGEPRDKPFDLTQGHESFDYAQDPQALEREPRDRLGTGGCEISVKGFSLTESQRIRKLFFLYYEKQQGPPLSGLCGSSELW